MPIKKFFRTSILVGLGAIVAFSLSTAAFSQDKAMNLPHESGIYYTIQKGDTLWDLSQRFYDSPALWPGLWEENNQIPNPHRIYPGERIRLYHQSGSQQIELVKKVEAKPVEAKPEPVVKAEAPYYYYSPIDSIGFFRKEPVDHDGFIFRSREDKVMISTGDIVYVRPQKHKTMTWGKKYTIYREFEATRGKVAKEFLANFGTQHYLTGVLEIIDSQADYYIARVIKNYRAIRVNDRLMPYKQRSPKIYLSESQKEMMGQIITNEDRDRMFGDNMVAFIDKGANNGIMTGQFYSVFYHDKHGFKFSDKKEGDILTPVDFATVLVMHTEDNTSTVLVTYSEKDLYPTAMIRTPVR